jgi:GNAT superfamily N-acetyltransferase
MNKEKFLSSLRAPMFLVNNGNRVDFHAVGEKSPHYLNLKFVSPSSVLGELRAADVAGSSEWVIGRRFVSPVYRRLGLGSMGFSLIEGMVRDAGGKSIAVSTNEKGTLVTALSLGYEPIGISYAELAEKVGLKGVQTKPELLKELKAGNAPNYVPNVDLKKTFKKQK